MPVYLAPEALSRAVERLGASSAKSRLCEFLIGLRALRLADDVEVGVAESVLPFMQALFEFTECAKSDTAAWDGPKFFNPFGTQAGFKSPKFQSNGPANTLHGWATQANAPFDVKATSPKAITRRVVSAENLRKFFLVSNRVDERPLLFDVAAWFYRFDDVAAPDGGDPSASELESSFIEAVGLTAADVDALFRRSDTLVEPQAAQNG